MAGISALPKSHFGKKWSYEVLTAQRQYAKLYMYEAQHYNTCPIRAFSEHSEEIKGSKVLFFLG